MQTHIKVRSHRTVNINSTSGHSAVVEANVVTEIPISLAEQAFAKGCFPVEPMEQAVAPAQPVPVSVPTGLLDDSDDVPLPPVAEPTAVEPDTTPEPMRTIVEAFDALVKANDRHDFRADGVPRMGAIRRALGREVTASEVDAAWVLYQKVV